MNENIKAMGNISTIQIMMNLFKQSLGISSDKQAVLITGGN